MTYHITSYGLSDIGLVRKNNEDVWAQLKNKHFFILADGMGGHQAGEVAASEAVNQLCDLVQRDIDFSKLTPEKVSKFLFSAIQQVNQNIYDMSGLDEKYKGMGTTLCCVLLLPKTIVYAHVGDSRIYLFRDEKLEQLTMDHSLLRELIELGQIEEKDIDNFAYKHIITRAMGTEPYVEPSIGTSLIQPEDLILMCSDGLSDLLSNQEIEQIISENPPEKIPKKLVLAAKHKGGNDNITVVLVKIWNNE